MKNLKDILYKVAVEAVYGTTDRLVKSIQFDSRKVEEKGLFVAIKGTVSDGHKFIDDVVAKGVSVIVCQDLPLQRNNEVTYVVVKDSNEALAIIASNFFDNP